MIAAELVVELDPEPVDPLECLPLADEPADLPLAPSSLCSCLRVSAIAALIALW
jgi:hypothetical protein